GNRLSPRRQSHPTDRRSACRVTFAATTRLLNAFGQGFAQVESKFPAAPCLIFIGTEGGLVVAGGDGTELLEFGEEVLDEVNTVRFLFGAAEAGFFPGI
ncbi:MAG: hypothetical protein ACLPKW_10085, partial [Acetobacteraceae bacterium]